VWVAGEAASVPRGRRRQYVAVPVLDERETVIVLEFALDPEVRSRAGVDAILRIAPVVSAVLSHVYDDDRARRSSARFRALTECAVEAIVAVGADGLIRFANRAFERTFGYQPLALIGSPAWNLLEGRLSNLETRLVPAFLRRAVRELGGRAIQVAGRRSDGTRVWLEVTLTDAHDDLDWRYTAVFRDISERRRVDAELARVLRSERKTAGRLRSIDESRRTFLRAAGHEVLDPLSVVRGLATLLSDDVEGRAEISDEDRRAAIAQLTRAAGRISELIDDLLSFERVEIDAVTLDRRATDLAELAKQVTRDVAEAVGADIAVQAEPVVVPVDRPQVETIVRNLLRNATRYAPESSIHVRVDEHPRGALLSVEDAGPGVPRRYRRAIFQPFRRGPAASGPGLGIGLSLVARFAEAHGGRAWVEDAPAGGAAFRVLLADPERARRRSGGIPPPSRRVP